MPLESLGQGPTKVPKHQHKPKYQKRKFKKIPLAGDYKVRKEGRPGYFLTRKVADYTFGDEELGETMLI